MSDLRDQLENYGPGDREVAARDGHYATVQWDDSLPEIGHVVAFRDDASDDVVYGVVRRHLGASRFRALLADTPDWFDTGTAVEATETPAAFTIDSDDTDGGFRRLEAAGVEIVPDREESDSIPFEPRRPDFGEIESKRTPVRLGWEPIDLLSPPVLGGVTLVVDGSGDRGAFEALVDRALDSVDPERALGVDPGDESQTARRSILDAGGTGSASGVSDMLALRAALSWAASERDRGNDVLLVLPLPGPTRTAESGTESATTPGLGELVDLIGSAAVSTDAASITTLLRFDTGNLDQGVSPILESMELGDVDAQIGVDEEGRYVPEDSVSDADLPGSEADRADQYRASMRRAREAEEHRRIFGDIELDDADREALETDDALRITLE